MKTGAARTCGGVRRTRPGGRRGVTLTELLVVIVIALVVAGIALAAMFGAPERARVRATEALIAKLDRALAAHLDAFNGDLLRAVKPAATDISLADGNNDADPEGDLTDVDRRAPVMMRKRMMREQFPERFVEIDAAFSWLNTLAFPGNLATQLPAPSAPALSQVYHRKINQLALGAAPSAHTAATESSECLYLILTTTGRQGIQVSEDQFTSRELRDTDGDGIPEFVDAWGNALRFYRWPVLNSPATGTSDVDPDDPNHTLLVVNWRTATSLVVTSQPNLYTYETDDTNNPPGWLPFHLATDLPGVNPQSYYYYPLIVSPGADGKFGLYASVNHAGDADPRNDPHERAALVEPSTTATDSEGSPVRDASFDNISNHQLRAGGTRK